MKTADHSCSGTGFRVFLCIGLFWLGLMVILNGQEIRTSPPDGGKQAARPEKDFTIRIGVEEVRLDAVVLDQKGRQITDLTADDFLIYQDGVPQKITSCSYINDSRPQPQTVAPAGASRDSRVTLSIPAPELKREDVRRTIVFVVDNLSMTLIDVHYARMALRKFVENQMQPGDLVAIVTTAGGNAALQIFSSDKRPLLSVINNVRWFMDTRTTTIMPQFMAVSYYIRALRDMPGRKSLIMISPQTMIPSNLVTDIGVFKSNLQPKAEYMENAFNPLADAALRAGVVIHTLDIRGLIGPAAYDGQFGAEKGLIGDPEDVASGLYHVLRAKDIHTATALRDTETPIPLSKKTGGLFVKDFNFFVGGIGGLNEALKGYYMLTYIPPADTFRKDLKYAYRRIRIKVRQPGSEVHTRDGFFGISQPTETAAEDTSSLRGAIFSPFRYNNLNVNLVSGYIHDPQKGYLIQSWLHLDAKDLSIVEGKEGSHSISVEAASVTSDTNSFIRDSSAQRFEFNIKREDIPWIREHGLKFSLALPVKKPGAYYVRAAVKDLGSGKIGSAYQFIEIPDLKKGRLSLSNIFFINRDEDAPWAQFERPQENQNIFYPDMRRDPRKSPALRSYLPGEDFEYAAMAYNAQAGKGERPDLESQYMLLGNDKELFRSEPKAVDLAGVSDFKRIPVKKKLTLGKAIQPGDYMLLLQVRDKRAKPKHNLAFQALDFKVLPK